MCGKGGVVFYSRFLCVVVVDLFAFALLEFTVRLVENLFTWVLLLYNFIHSDLFLLLFLFSEAT